MRSFWRALGIGALALTLSGLVCCGPAVAPEAAATPSPAATAALSPSPSPTLAPTPTPTPGIDQTIIAQPPTPSPTPIPVPESVKVFFFEDEKDEFTEKVGEAVKLKAVAYPVDQFPNATFKWSVNDESVIKLTVSETGHYFVFWRTGTIEPDSDEAKQAAGLAMVNPAVHVASFNAAYRCVAVMEWLFGQAKVFYDVVK